jgi:DNA-binding beta-propeller fold protein YncE
MSIYRPSLVTTCLLLAALLLAALTLAACNNQPTNPPGAEATIAALATSNAALATQVAEMGAALGTPAVAPAVDVTAPVAEATAPAEIAVDSAAPISPLPGAPAVTGGAPGSLLPRLLANLPLAPEGATLNDLRFDPGANRLYIADTDEQVHVVDATTYTVLTTLPGLGSNLELDTRNGRLYVYRAYVREGEEPTIHVIDTATLAEVGVLRGGAIAIDAERNRLFVGAPFTYSSPADAPGVQVIDGATLQVLGEIDQPGAPLYNPARNEVLIVAYTVYTADPETLQVTGDLFPELTDLNQIGFLWCNGCRWAERAWVLPETGMIAVDIRAHCTGKGCGVEDAPRWLDAATLAPIDPATAPEAQTSCGAAFNVAGAVGDRIYRSRFYNRYLIFSNLLVSDAAGAPVTLRDGLSIDFVNAHTGHGYLPDGTVLDLATLTPVGRWPAACVMGYDAAQGRLFARRAGNLYIIAEAGGAPPEQATPRTETLPDTWITGIKASPDFAADATLLAEVETGDLYRSTDSGATWVKLRGGLPDDDYQNLYAFFSPNYAVDRTIYVTGHRSDYWGYGVWRSTDGGETWAPLWNNLVHLRGEAITFASDFAQSQTLVLKARFHDVLTGVSGASYQQSTDGGLSWTLVVTGSNSTPAGAAPLPPVSELLPGASLAVAPVVEQDLASNQVRFSADGSAWLTTTITTAPGELLLGIFPTPGDPADPAIYVASESALWRSLDAGVTWAQWGDARFADPDDLDNKIHALAVSPLLADGSHRLFIGTGAGEVITLDPTTLAWTPLAASPVAATDGALTAALPTPTPAAVTPLTGEPPAGFYRPAGDLALRWENDARVQQALGWATAAAPTSGPAALQRFENGVMVWVQENGRIYAFLNDGSWRNYPDDFREGDAESDPAFSPPDGREQPVRGFGKVWREHADLRDAIGWALAKEEPATAARLPFERGEVLRVGVFAYALTGSEAGDWH